MAGFCPPYLFKTGTAGGAVAAGALTLLSSLVFLDRKRLVWAASG